MPRVRGSVPNLINGISQQAPDQRLPSQGEVCTNYYPSIVEGLTQRPRTDFLAELGSAFPDATFTHIMIRDDTEKYVLAILPDLTMKVWDFQGNLKTLTNSGASYLAGVTDPAKELRAVTVADHTFIVNKNKVVLAGAATEPTRPKEAMISVVAGNYAKRYSIKIGAADGSGIAEKSFFLTPDGGSASQGGWIDTSQIAHQLYTGLVTGSSGGGSEGGMSQGGSGGYNTAPWATGRYQSTIYLRNVSSDFTLAIEDGAAGNAMKMVKGKVQKFSDLPSHGHADFVAEVAGDPESGAGKYWVKFKKTNDATSAGIWEECVAPGSVLGLDAATMPHILVRNSDGTFTFKPAVWDTRQCGDVAEVPHPSFVGQTIEEVFFHRNRFGILTKENYVLSEAGSFFNFFRTTLTALLDTDPIDGAASHVKVSLLRHAVPYSEVMLLFSDQTQFRLDGNDLLTPKTVQAKPLSELSSNPTIRPVTSGTSIYFTSEGTDWASMYEYYIDKSIQSADSENVSGHAPSYIPAGVHHVVASSDLDLVFVATNGEPGSLYAYKFHYNGQEKLQSAWVRWTFPGVQRIFRMEFDRKSLVMVVRRGSGIQLESINCEQGIKDPSLNYRVALDRHAIRTGTYSALNDETTITLPYGAQSGMKFVTAPGGTTPAGVELTPKSLSAYTVKFNGDVTGTAIRFGIEYEARYRFSPFYFRGADGKQGNQDGKLTIAALAVEYSKAANFRIEVQPDGRPLKNYPFTSQLIGDPDTLIGGLPVKNGRFSVPVMSRSDRVTIDLIADTWRPASFTSAKWRGTFNHIPRQTT